ncbi:MAG: pyridoxine 5'-phosphate synthase [Desulfobulbaceae bacterium]|jgi:pyridoxine 5-phosphate synthase|nr:pyridoxine 5'-phosphate synthase [Desulfobulbaceae bacterium]MDH3775872.1 pyridoxine 5'-phosphate synthase [Desulfobulbaceae bacterium]MDH3865969.1 pyridoxine 5'-phosphate synthase [Desulfobulbaceae bacterium]MDH3996232.1 pyridoxine 5'-phosphate synthase [Desulfobulbaceae bacterium]HKJ15464.1 pyridoxine 5'-phosphate synthase [Desulfobulbales bacterium]
MPVLFRNEFWSQLPRVNEALVRRTAERLLVLTGMPDAELSLLLADDKQIAELNSSWRRKNGPTNVLAFSLTEGPDSAMALNMLGDIVISVEIAAREAEKAGLSLHSHLQELLVHGFLHLIGYDHEKSGSEAVRMHNKERELLQELTKKRREKMIKLAVNVDHVATLREARGTSEPDPVLAAGICELAGAEGIVVHLREDRRHIQDRDVRLLRQTVKTKLNLEMGATEEIIKFALDIQPDMVTLVPEKRKELTTEGGLNVAGQKKKLKMVIDRMNDAGIPVSLFVDPDSRQIGAAKDAGATFVEIHTGRYSDAAGEEERDQEFELIASAAEEAYEAGLRVNAGHGLNYFNTGRIAALDTIEELSIGHAIMARAIMVGLDQAVREMLGLMI